ncbi:hypothetical protein O3P69_005230 [Scylla paramamosain]|uniref:Uncharacterized protein n=1 Tax=Scylla paramamosain TaxID=85552 RepID=A0AAW0UCK4_SCYPA
MKFPSRTRQTASRHGVPTHCVEMSTETRWPGGKSRRGAGGESAPFTTDAGSSVHHISLLVRDFTSRSSSRTTTTTTTSNNVDSSRTMSSGGVLSSLGARFGSADGSGSTGRHSSV